MIRRSISLPVAHRMAQRLPRGFCETIAQSYPREARLAIDKVESLLASKEFVSIWRLLNERFVRWEEFCQMPMPPGTDAKTMWCITRSLLRGAGIELNHPGWCSTDPTETMWFSVPRTTERAVREIQARTDCNSILWNNIKSNNSIYFMLYLLQDDLISTFRRDGISLAAHEMRRLCYFHESASNDAQRVFYNLSGLFERREELFGGAKIDECLIWDIYNRLNEGVEQLHVTTSPLDAAYVNHDLFSSEYVLDRICRFAAGAGSDADLNPLFVGMEFSRYLWDYKPLPMLNACVELVLRNIYYRNCGLPVAGIIPTSCIEDRRSGQNLGIVVDPKSGQLQDEYRIGGFDSTNYHETTIMAYLDETKRLSERVNLFLRRRQMQIANVEALDNVNARQKDILLSFLARPDHKVTIKEHYKNTGVSYPPARSDLQELEELGYLRHKVDSRAFLYEAGPRLRELA